MTGNCVQIEQSCEEKSDCRAEAEKLIFCPLEERVRIPQGSLTKSVAVAHFSGTLNTTSGTGLGHMNGIGPCFDESIPFIKTVGKWKR